MSDAQEQLNAILVWERVYAWAKAHKQAPFLATDPRYLKREALGISGNPLFCPLACYINEHIAGSTDWHVSSTGKAYRYEYDRGVYYPLPKWAKLAEEAVDSVGTFVSVDQALFVAILEAVKPREEVQP